MGLAVTAFLVVIFFFQHLIVRLHINDEGIDEECGGDQQQDVGKQLADGRKQDQQDQMCIRDRFWRLCQRTADPGSPPSGRGDDDP